MATLSGGRPRKPSTLVQAAIRGTVSGIVSAVDTHSSHTHRTDLVDIDKTFQIAVNGLLSNEKHNSNTDWHNISLHERDSFTFGKRTSL